MRDDDGAMDADQARAIALALPEVIEQDHFGMPSFRLRRNVLATLPDGGHLRVMVDESEIRAAVAEDPGVCSEFWWGKRLACVVVALPGASPELVHDLLASAWLRRAPKTLARQYEGKL